MQATSVRSESCVRCRLVLENFNGRRRLKLVVTTIFWRILSNRVIYLPIFRTNQVRGFWNKEMKIQNKGAVLVQIAPLFISQPRNQNQSICSGRNRIWRRLSVFCHLSVKVCSWYKTHSNTGILAGVR